MRSLNNNNKYKLISLRKIRAMISIKMTTIKVTNRKWSVSMDITLTTILKRVMKKRNTSTTRTNDFID